MAPEYRIITNGISYRIQVKTVKGFWKHIDIWRTLGSYIGLGPRGVMPLEYDSKEAAQEKIELEKKRHEWTEVR